MKSFRRDPIKNRDNPAGRQQQLIHVSCWYTLCTAQVQRLSFLACTVYNLVCNPIEMLFPDGYYTVTRYLFVDRVSSILILILVEERTNKLVCDRFPLRIFVVRRVDDYYLSFTRCKCLPFNFLILLIFQRFSEFTGVNEFSF